MGTAHAHSACSALVVDRHCCEPLSIVDMSGGTLADVLVSVGWRSPPVHTSTFPHEASVGTMSLASANPCVRELVGCYFIPSVLDS
jgi:hypothetical protein